MDVAAAAAAGDEGLSPLLGARLDAGLLRAETAGVHAELTAAYHNCLAWTLFASSASRELITALGQSQIPVLALKGSALIRTVLRPGERPMVDLDFLIPAAHFSRARLVAARSGATIFDPLCRPITALHDYALPLHTREGLSVELHRYFCEKPLFRPDYDGPNGIFARAAATDDGILIPDLVDLFLGLAIHAAHHAYLLPLRAVVDGLVLGSSRRLLLAAVANRARRWRAATATAAFLLVLKKFGLDRPDLDFALEELGAPASLSRMLGDAPWPETETHEREWRRRLRVARLLDHGLARVGYFGQRVGLRAADSLWKGFLRLRGRAGPGQRPVP